MAEDKKPKIISNVHFVWIAGYEHERKSRGNYWLSINEVRTVQVFEPKDKDGLWRAFLNTMPGSTEVSEGSEQKVFEVAAWYATGQHMVR